jgi:hypothetical protein
MTISALLTTVPAVSKAFRATARHEIIGPVLAGEQPDLKLKMMFRAACTIYVLPRFGKIVHAPKASIQPSGGRDLMPVSEYKIVLDRQVCGEVRS